ncbi:MAG: hypothetical protein ACEQSR_06420 [Candidatus Methylacidiphilales bacterium]
MLILINKTKQFKLVVYTKDLAIATIMLGLLLAFSKMVKFVVFLVQELNNLSNSLSNEMETIDRTSKHIITLSNGSRHWEVSNELNLTAENLSRQISNNQVVIIMSLILSLVAFVVLYFAIDFLIEYTQKFKPWSIILLLTAFISTVFYSEFIDLRNNGNGFLFLFTTTISIITGIILIGYTLLFTNYRSVEE